MAQCFNLIGMKKSDTSRFDNRVNFPFVIGEGTECNIPIGIERALKEMKANNLLRFDEPLEWAKYIEED